MSTDSTIEVLIYIRHGTSTPQSKSAEKLNEAESVASPLPPQPLHSANSTGLPDQRITGGFGVSDQKSKEVSLQIQSFVDFYVREVKKDKQKKKKQKGEDRQLQPALKLKVMKRRGIDVKLFWKPVTRAVWPHSLRD